MSIRFQAKANWKDRPGNPDRGATASQLPGQTRGQRGRAAGIRRALDVRMLRTVSTAQVGAPAGADRLDDPLLRDAGRTALRGSDARSFPPGAELRPACAATVHRAGARRGPPASERHLPQAALATEPPATGGAQPLRPPLPKVHKQPLKRVFQGLNSLSQQRVS